MGRLIGILLVIWLIIGAFAAYQRGYFDDSDTNCSEASDIALNVVAGPLNYAGVSMSTSAHSTFGFTPA